MLGPLSPSFAVHMSPHRARAEIAILQNAVETAGESHEIQTRYGPIRVVAKTTTFNKYPGMETGPEGYALAIHAPAKLILRIVDKSRNEWHNHLLFVIVDGRKIEAKRLRHRTIVMKGGNHELSLAWTPGE